MKKILLPTDFSDNSWNAIIYALQLFKDETCNFFLLNTYTPIFYHMEQVLVASPEMNIENIVRENSERRLEEMKTRMEQEFANPNHTYSSIAAFNTLIGEIDELYRSNVMELIVMGTKGASGLKEVLFGTNTVHTIKNAKCPVLAIPDKFEYEAPHEILFPSDYEVMFTQKQLQPVIDIAANHHARVNVLHVSYGQALSEKQEKNKNKLEAYLKPVSNLFHELSNQDVSDAISNFQLKARINLLVMINNKHSFFENVFFKPKVNQISFHLNIPFLVIPSKAK